MPPVHTYTEKEIREAQLKMEEYYQSNKKASHDRQKSHNERHIYCGHDFWDKAREMEYGQVIKCESCNQWFVIMRECVYINGNDVKEYVCKLGGRYYNKISMGYRE